MVSPCNTAYETTSVSLLNRLPGMVQVQAQADGADSFVQLDDDGNFILGCSYFPISGFNVWEMVETGTGATRLSGSQLPAGFESGQDYVRSVLDTAKDSGFTVVRAWAHGVTEDYASMDVNGQVNETMMQGLDFVVSEAKRRGLKLILSFTSNWTPAGGVDFFAQVSAGGEHNEFFTDPQSKDLYKQFVSNLLQRKNTKTGVQYKDDTTIMAWDLCNEPVCRDCAPGAVADWVQEMAQFVKSIDSNHLLTVGEEGFYHITEASISSNPMYGESSWATEWRQDFVEDHLSESIDFMTFHAWPDLWNCKDCGALSPEFFKNWIQQHVEDARRVGKPVILEEFGKKPDGRDEYYRIAYEAVENSLANNDVLVGALFWQFYSIGQEATQGEGGGGGPFGVYPTDSTFSLAVENARRVNELYQSMPSNPALGRCFSG